MPTDPTKDLASQLGDLYVDDDEEDCLIIGIDFGTTFSGIAYAFSNEPDKIYPVTEWPGRTGKGLPKAPTVIRYDASNPDNFQWGYQLNNCLDKIRGIKLLLDPEQELPLCMSGTNLKEELRKIPKPPVEVVTDFLIALYNHAIANLSGKYPKDYLQMMTKKFVLSVPAVWSEKAKAATERAARQAGISNPKLIKEPEAAALYTLHFLKNRGLSTGEAFILCDCGGGTVDLISYQISNLVPLELKELVPGKGGMAGSMMLNKLFEEHVKNIVGEEKFFALRQTNGYMHGLNHFDECVKPAFTGEDSDEFFVNFPMANIPDDKANDLVSNCLRLTGKTMKKLFEPIIKEIRGLVTEQVNLVRLKRLEDGQSKDIKAIFLVGGFGASKYLLEQLQQAHPDIQVIQPNDAWSAIVQGAVLSSLPHEATVVSTVATKHLGVSSLSRYDEDIHGGQEKIWDTYERIHRVRKMTWYVYQGDDLLRDREISFPFYRTVPENYDDDDLIFVSDLKESAETLPPKFPTTGLVHANCTITSDLRGVPRSEFKLRKNSDGLNYYDIHYQLMVNLESALMVFSLQIRGKTYGRATAEYR